MMNLLFYAPQMASYGGMERHVCGLASACAVHGHSVTLVTTSNSLSDDLRLPLLRDGIELRELSRRRGSASRLQKAIWLLKESCRARRRHWDLIYTNGQSALACLLWCAAKSNTRVLHHHHTAADPDEQRTWSRTFRKVLERAPELVACSNATREALGNAVCRNDVRFLPYLTKSAVKENDVCERQYASDSRLHFGFLGRLVPEKGIDMICHLSERPELAGIEWHIHGAGEEYPPRFFSDFKNVVYHGAYQGSVEQGALLQRLDALVLFSRHNEGMPLSLIEGMSAGLPWIATDQGGTRELARSRTDCVIVQSKTDLSALSSAVVELARRLRSGDTSRQRQRKIYDQFFGPTAVSTMWLGYFERALEK